MISTKNDLPEIAKIIGDRLNSPGFRKNQREVAAEVGFKNQNVISILKSGMTKLAIDRVGKMAKALDMPVQKLMEPALRQFYSRETIETMREAFNAPKSKFEKDLLDFVRAECEDTRKISLTTEMKAAIKDVLTSS